MSSAQAGKQDLYGPGASPRGRSFFSPAQRWLLLALSLIPALAALIHSLRHPGIAAPDELSVLAWIEHARRGELPWPVFGRGYPAHILLWAWTNLGPRSLGWLQLFPSIVLASEILLLGRWAAGLGGATAGLGAASLAALSAFDQLRARTLLSFNLCPLLMLLLPLSASRAARSRSGSLVWGLALGLGLLNYDAWVLAVPILLADFAWRGRGRGLAWALLGFALVTGALLATWPHPADWITRRAAQRVFSLESFLSQRWLALKAAFWGWPGPQELDRWPLLPWFALPFLAAGLGPAWRDHHLLLAWAVLGLLPLSMGDGLEARRAIIALPALAGLVGLGAAAFPKTARRALWLLPLVALIEALALDRALSARDQACYAHSRRHARAAQALEELYSGPAPAPLVFCSGRDHGAELYFLNTTRDLGPAPILVQASYTTPKPDPKLGDWSEVRVPGAAPVYWLSSRPKDQALWRERDALGHRLTTASFLFDQSFGYLTAHTALAQARDPWQRTQCLEAMVDCSLRLGALDEALLELLESENLLSSSPLLLSAAWLEDHDPARALRLARKAMALDPRRGKGWLLLAQLAKRQGLQAEADQALIFAKNADPDF